MKRRKVMSLMNGIRCSGAKNQQVPRSRGFLKRLNKIGREEKSTFESWMMKFIV